MVFSGLPFLFFYLVVTLLIYKLTPLKLRNLVLLIASLFFYGWGEPVYIVIMFLSIAVDYTHGMLVERWRENDRKARMAVASSVFLNLLILVTFKYYDFLAGSLNSITGWNIPLLGVSMPIGISFYTFQTMSYTIDVYRKDAPVQRNIVTFGTFVTLFPQLIAGPIIQYKSVADQLQCRREDLEKFVSGIQRFCVGLAKKVLLANAVGKLWDVFLATDTAELTVLGGWLGLIAYAFQIYFDFSGYSDMAIGLGRIFGFKYMENFNLPYAARSITDFWRRWHMSLSSFFRDYVYIPLGGNRRHRWFNLLVTWCLTGLWHGASWNFLLWGFYFFVLLSVEKPLLKKLRRWPNVVRNLLTMFLVVIGWTIFYFTDFARLGQAFAVMFGFAGSGFVSGQVRILLLNNLPLLLLCILGSSILPRAIGNYFGVLCARRPGDGNGRQLVFVTVSYVFSVALIALSTVSLVGSGFSAFLYYRF